MGIEEKCRGFFVVTKQHYEYKQNLMMTISLLHVASFKL